MEGLNAIVAYIRGYLVAMYQLQLAVDFPVLKREDIMSINLLHSWVEIKNCFLLLQREIIGKAITNLERDGFNASPCLCCVSPVNYFRIF